jgi:hypothetical protein
VSYLQSRSTPSAARSIAIAGSATDSTINTGMLIEGGVQNHSIVIVHNHYGAAPATHQAASKLAKEVLAEMGALTRDNRISVLVFMEREFRTRMVIELNQAALGRVMRYVKTVLINQRKIYAS